MTQTHSKIKATALLLLVLVLAAGLLIVLPGLASDQEAVAATAVVVSLQNDVEGATFAADLDGGASIDLSEGQAVEFVTTPGSHQVTVTSNDVLELDASCDAAVSIDLSSMNVEGDTVSTSRSVVVDTASNETTTCTFKAIS